MSVQHILILSFAALAGGVLNSVAGGGTFVVFPTLILSGMPSVSANATSTMALWPGTVASVGAYREDLRTQRRRLLLVLALASVVGALAGAALLLHTPQATFTQLVPWLLLVATLLFVVNGPVMARVRVRAEHRAERAAQRRMSAIAAGATENASREEVGAAHPVSSPAAASRGPTRLSLLGAGLFQLAVATYGGYFGGGMGIVILAMLGLIGLTNINTMNGIKTLVASCTNGVAIITFTIAGIIDWPVALLMLGGAIIGGYGGAHFARKIEPAFVRRLIALIAIGMTVYFFNRTYDLTASLIPTIEGWLGTYVAPAGPF